MSDQETAEEINTALEDPVPSMGDAPITTVELIRGLYDADQDVWHTDAEVRELNGEDEEYLASIESKKDLIYAEYITHVLSRAVTRIGSVTLTPKTAPTAVSKLIMGDRDTLFLGIVKATYGDTRDIQMMCGSCGASNDVELDLDEDFPMQKPSFDVKKGLKVETSKGTISLRLPNSEDIVMGQKETKTDAEFNTYVLSRCAVWTKNKAPSNPLEWARKLNIGDRKKLVNALLDIEIGPKMGEVNTQCASCGEDMPILLDWVSLLFS